MSFASWRQNSKRPVRAKDSRLGSANADHLNPILAQTSRTKTKANFSRGQTEMRRQVIAVLALTGFILVPPAALGCSCVYLPKHSTAFRKASAVFIGEVVSTSRPKLPGNWDSEHAPPVMDFVTFKVERRWKGARKSEVDAWVDMRFNCGSLRFRVGEKYLVYADSYKGSLVIYWCEKASLTESLSSEGAQQRVKQLNSRQFRMRARLL